MGTGKKRTTRNYLFITGTILVFVSLLASFLMRFGYLVTPADEAYRGITIALAVVSIIGGVLTFVGGLSILAASRAARDEKKGK